MSACIAEYQQSTGSGTAGRRDVDPWNRRSPGDGTCQREGLSKFRPETSGQSAKPQSVPGRTDADGDVDRVHSDPGQAGNTGRANRSVSDAAQDGIRFHQVAPDGFHFSGPFRDFERVQYRR